MGIVVVDENGKKIGEMGFDEAKKLASSLSKDLVSVNPKLNVYKIIDAGKLKYEQKQKEKNQRAQKRTHKVKEIKFGLNTEKHDIDIKTKHICEFLEKGFKTKITIQLHGRELSFKDTGIQKINDIISLVINTGSGILDRGPIVEGKNIIAFINPAKNNSNISISLPNI